MRVVPILVSTASLTGQKSKSISAEYLRKADTFDYSIIAKLGS